MKSRYFGYLAVLVTFGVWACFPISPFCFFSVLLISCNILHWGISSLLAGFSPVELWSEDTSQLVCQYLRLAGAGVFHQEFSEAARKIDLFVISEGIGISRY